MAVLRRAKVSGADSPLYANRMFDNDTEGEGSGERGCFLDASTSNEERCVILFTLTQIST